MYRSDYNGPQPSARIQFVMGMKGGLNIYGQPRYRLVHSEFRRTPSGGTWLDWDDELSTAERKDGVKRPLRRVVETRQVLLYPNTIGQWILEKWCTPESYGTREDWYKPVTQGGTIDYIPHARRSIATLGDYPHLGEYENIGYAFPPEAVTENIIMTAIGRIEHAIDTMPSTPEGRVLRRLYNARQAEELKRQHYEMHAGEILRDADFAFDGRIFSSGYGTKQPHSSKRLLRKLGISQHHID